MSDCMRLEKEFKQLISMGMKYTVSGKPVSPKKLASMIMTCENGCYMAEYISDDDKVVSCTNYEFVKD